MDDFVKQHGVAVFYIMSTIIVLLTSLLGYFLKWDRKKFLEKLEVHDQEIDKMNIDLNTAMNTLRKELTDEVNYAKGEIDSVRTNYNKKFERVYEKLDIMYQANNENQIKLIKAIHSVDIKVASLQKD